MTTRLTPFSLVSGPTLTTGDPASCVPTRSTLVLPRGYFTEGKTLRLRAAGVVTTVLTRGAPCPDLDPGYMRFQLQLNSTTVFDSGKVPFTTLLASSSRPFTLEMSLKCMAVGAGSSTTFIGTGVLSSAYLTGSSGVAAKAGRQVVLPFDTAPAAGSGVDSTVDQRLDLVYSQGVSGGSMSLLQYVVTEV